jgi:hypothetical protein
MRNSVNESQRQGIVIQRWKARVEPQLIGLVATMNTKPESLDALVENMPGLFDMETWEFSPPTILEEEKTRVEDATTGGDDDAFLAVVPGKQLVPIAAQAAGMAYDAYSYLIVTALAQDSAFEALSGTLVRVLEEKLPDRAHSSPALRGLAPPAA